MILFGTLLALMGCGAPYADYWDQAGRGPTIDGVWPDSNDGLQGGTEILITGTQLGTTQTVVFGGRNAWIVEALDDAVTVVLPDGIPGGGPVDVGLATTYGIDTASGAFDYMVDTVYPNEAVSIVLMRYDCPVTAFGQFGASPQPLVWCGFEGGWMDVFAWDGIGPQPGYAGELAGVAPLSLLPPEGEVRFVGPGDRPQPSVPYLYDVHATGERWALSTPRDFAADLVAVEEAIARVDATYYWAPYVSGYVAPLAFFYDDEQCFSDEVVITSGSGDTLEVASPPAGDGVWIGYAVKEAVYDTGDTADTSGFELTSVGVATAHIEEIAGTSVVGMPSGVTLSYDEFSGYFLDAGVGATLGSAELPNNAVFDLAYTRMEQTEDLGTVASGAALVVTKPDLLDGQRLINVEKDFTVRWLPGDG